MYLHSHITRKFFQTIFSLSILFIAAGILAAQNPLVDEGFNPSLTRESSYTGNSISGNMLIQPDGKIIVIASYGRSDGLNAKYFLRLNADGTIDNTFNCTICSDMDLNDPQLLPDGRILAHNVVPFGDGTSRVRLIYLNPDGSLNNTVMTQVRAGFNPGLTPIHNIIWAVQPDGKIFIETIDVRPGSTFRTLWRINPDGTFDSTFQQLGTSSRTFRFVNDIALLPDGKFYISGDNYSVARFNANGTQDTSFESQQLTCSSCGIGGAPGVYNFAVQPDGKIVTGGNFNSVNGIARIGLARLHPAGNVDLDFNPSLPFSNPNSPSVTRVEITPDNKIIVQGNFANGVRLLRLNADGSIDNTFNVPTNINFLNWKLDALGRVVFFGGLGDGTFKFGRLNPNGSLETTFNLPASKGGVSTIARQADGKLIVAGDFDKINGIARNKIARLNADGSVDASFNSGAGFDAVPVALVVQPDGRILAGGSFTTVNGAAQANLARLNADGTLDATFNPGADAPVLGIALQADGKILIVGAFNNVGGVSRTRLARLNSDGSLDTAFNPLISVTGDIRAVVAEPDGKIVIGGSFSSINGFARANMARLNADGSVDTSFNASSISSGLKTIIRQPDGKYLILSSDSNSSLVTRRLNNGSPDAGFTNTTVDTQNGGFVINAIALKPDGTIIIGGIFNSIQSFARRNIARLLPNGALDKFYLLNGANGAVRALLAQPDGKTVVGGFFTSIENVSRSGLARLNNAPVITGPPDFDFDGDGRADLSVFRPSAGFWYIARPTGTPSQNFDAVQFGANGDLPVPADYDGDGKTDVAVWRPSDGTWYLMQSTAGFRAAQFGANGDIPVPGDFDGDGKANLAVFRPSTGAWYIARPTGTPSQNFDSIPFGANGDKPIVGADFDGDGRADVAVFRPSDGNWYRINSSNNQFVGIHFGIAEDKPVAADYDGDGKTDLAVWRPSDGVWYRINSGTDSFTATQFGISSDRPSPADYDGDGRTDLAVFRPSEGIWYLLRSQAGFTGIQFGASGDLPAPNAFVR